MNIAFMPACVHGDMIIRVSTIDGASTPEMKMATACVKSMSIPWKGFGRSCGAGCALIGAFHKKNFRSTSGSSSLCTMPENEAKRCFMGSLNYWSHKTLESNMSQVKSTYWYLESTPELMVDITQCCEAFVYGDRA